MKVLVIGGSGSLSAPLAKHVGKIGHEVFVFNRGTRAERIPKGCTHIKGDRRDLESFREQFQGIGLDAVIDCFAYLPTDIEDDLRVFGSPKHFIFISSVDVYGGRLSRIPAREEDEPHPESAYGKNKHAIEKILMAEFEKRLFPVTVFRCEHILGPGNFVASLWGRSPYIVDRIKKGKPIPLMDGGRNLLTPVFADDAAWGIAASLFNPVTFGQTYNVVGPGSVTLKDYVTCIGEVVNKTVNIKCVPAEVHGKIFQDQSHLFYHRCYSFEKLRSAIGYDPKHSVLQALRITIKWMEDTGNVKNCEEDPFDDKLTAFLGDFETKLEELLRSKGYASEVEDGWSSRKGEADSKT